MTLEVVEYIVDKVDDSWWQTILCYFWYNFQSF